MSVTDLSDPSILEARQKAALGQTQEAHILYEDLLEKNPAHPVALSENGLLYMSTKHYEEAMMYLESARGVADSEKLQLAVSECLLRLGLTEDAVEVLTNTLNETPLSVSGRILMALALNQLDQGGESLIHIEVALKLEPSNASAQRIKAVSMCQMGLFKDGLALFEAAQSIEANKDTFVAFQIAEALYKYDQLEDCILQVNSLLELDQNHIEALMLKSNALEDLNRLEEADSVMEQISLLTASMPDMAEV